jgi:hypothetical protein
MTRLMRNIQFTNCQFYENFSSGVVVDPGATSGFEFNNITFTDCSFANPAWNVIFQSGIVKNARFSGCFFNQLRRLDVKGNPISNYPSFQITTVGTGSVIGCDFVSEDEEEGKPDIIFGSHITISLDAPPTPAIWRLLGNHFKSSVKNNPAINIEDKMPNDEGVLNPRSKVVIAGNHFEFVSDDPSTEEDKHPFVWIINGDPSRHIIHSNIGDGQVYSSIKQMIDDGSGKLKTVMSDFEWIDVSPGIPMTLGSATTKGRNVPAKGRGRPVGRLEVGPPYYQVISLGADLHPLLPGVPQPAQVDYQVEVTFQWDAGSWWISDKDNDKFTLNWTKAAPPNAKFDWTLHL